MPKYRVVIEAIHSKKGEKLKAPFAAKAVIEKVGEFYSSNATAAKESFMYRVKNDYKPGKIHILKATVKEIG